MCCDEVEPSAGSGMPKEAAASSALLQFVGRGDRRRRAAGARRDAEADDAEIEAAFGAQVAVADQRGELARRQDHDVDAFAVHDPGVDVGGVAEAHGDAMAGRLLDHRRQLNERRPHRGGAEDDEIVGLGAGRRAARGSTGRGESIAGAPPFAESFFVNLRPLHPTNALWVRTEP